MLAGIWARIPPGQVIAVHVFDLAKGKCPFSPLVPISASPIFSHTLSYPPRSKEH